MNSPFANIYLSLLQYINDQLPEIVYIDMDYGQLETKERPSVAFPCLLLDFQEFEYQELGALAQTTIGTLSLKLATDPYSSTSSITPDEYKEAALYIMDLEWKLYKVLQGFKPFSEYDNTNTPTAQTQPLIRRAVTSDNRRPGLKVRHLSFTCSFTDRSAQRTYATAPATPAITSTIDLTIPIPADPRLFPPQ
jgi:hypothetical protein